MKGKFRKILGVGLALALVLSFSLVAAVPAAALTQPTVTVSPNLQLVVGAEYTINFSVTKALAAGVGTITIDFTGSGTVPAEDKWFTSDVTVNDDLVFGDGTGSDKIDATVAPTVKITVPEDIDAGDSVKVVFKASAGITNPSAGAHTLKVLTSKESVVTSAQYIIAGYPGKAVSVYTSTGLFVNSYTTISEALGKAGANYTVTVDPGTYTASGTLNIYDAGLTLESTGDAAETIISNSVSAILCINSSGVTIDGFTFKGSIPLQMGIHCVNTGFTIQNNKFIDIGGHNIQVDSTLNVMTSGTIDSNTLIGEGANHGAYSNAINMGSGEDISGVTISNNILSNFGTTAASPVVAGISLLSGGSGSISGITIKGNTVTDSSLGLFLYGTLSSIDVTDNTFSGCRMGLNTSSATLTNLVITGNDITGNTKDGIKIESWNAANTIKFNNISGNLYGIKNTTATAVNATHNWWGTDVGSEIAGMITGTGTTTYDPWLGASMSVADYAASASSLNAQSTVGVQVNSSTATNIGVAHYTGNPQEAHEFTAIEDGYFDVYVASPAAGWSSGDMVAIKLYSDLVTSTSKAYFYSEFYGGWQKCYEQIAVTGNYVWVKVRLFNIDHPECVPILSDLAGTPFAISGEEAAEDIVDYYRGADGVVSTSELLTGITDWAAGTIPSGFTESLTTTQLLTLITEWAS